MSGSVSVTLTLLILGASVGKICHMLRVVTMNAKASSITTKVNGDTSTTTAFAVLRGVLPHHHLCQVALAEHTRASIDAFILSCSLCAVHMQSTHAAILGAVLGLTGSALLFFFGQAWYHSYIVWSYTHFWFLGVCGLFGFAWGYLREA